MNNKSLNNKSYNLINFLDVFLIVFLTSGFAVTNNIISSSIIIGLWIFVLGSILFFKKKRLVLDSTWTQAFILMISLSISYFINNDNMMNAAKIIFSFIVVLLYAVCVDFNEFKHIFISLMKWLCVISLVGYALFLIVPGLHGLFTIRNNAGLLYSNLILYVDSAGNNRNMGLFWEPGAFQAFINLALLFEVLDSKPDIKTIVIFVFTVLTTYSTTGYIALLFIVLLIYINKGQNDKLKGTFTLLLILASVFLYFYSDMFFGQTLQNGQSTVFGKINGYINGNQTSNSNFSADIRYNSIFEVSKAFFEKPFFGYSYQGLIQRTYQYTRGMNTCTFINWFATFGLFYGIAMTISFCKLTNLLSKRRLSKIVIFFIFFVITMSENFVYNAFFILIALYGNELARSNSTLNNISESFV